MRGFFVSPRRDAETRGPWPCSVAEAAADGFVNYFMPRFFGSEEMDRAEANATENEGVYEGRILRPRGMQTNCGPRVVLTTLIEVVHWISGILIEWPKIAPFAGRTDVPHDNNIKIE